MSFQLQVFKKLGTFCDRGRKGTLSAPGFSVMRNGALREAKVCQNEALYTKAPKGATLPCSNRITVMNFITNP